MSVSWITPSRLAISLLHPSSRSRVYPYTHSLERRQGLEGRNNPKSSEFLGVTYLKRKNTTFANSGILKASIEHYFDHQKIAAIIATRN